jgi:hypothetical protein
MYTVLARRVDQFRKVYSEMLIPSGFCLASYRITVGLDPEEMVVTCGHALPAVTPLQAANALEDAWRDIQVPAQYGADVVWRGVTVQVGTNASGEGPFFTQQSAVGPLNSPGTSALVPQNTALLVRKATDQPGRRGRGRMYIPGAVSEAGVSNIGIIDSTSVVNRQTAFNNWLSRLTTEGYDPVVLHQTGDPSPAFIVGFFVSNLAATQRRRMRR